MEIRNFTLKVWVSFLIYMFIYGNLLFIKYYPNMMPRDLLLRTIGDLFHLHLVPLIIFVVILILSFALFKVSDKKNKKKELELELSSIQKKRDEGTAFVNAINTLKHTRFSYILGQNSSMIYSKRVDYLYEEARYLKVTMDLLILNRCSI